MEENLKINNISLAVCDILGYSNNCFVLKEMKKFRKDIVPFIPKYSLFLKENNDVVEELATNIEEDYQNNDNKDKWVQFYKLYLSEIANLLASGLYEEAFIKYQSMISTLEEHFELGEESKIKNKKIAYA